jgi:hypothetical protein
LSRPIVFGPTAQPIRYDEIDELALPWEASIVGWGATFVSENSIINVLRITINKKKIQK